MPTSLNQALSEIASEIRGTAAEPSVSRETAREQQLAQPAPRPEQSADPEETSPEEQNLAGAPDENQEQGEETPEDTGEIRDLAGLVEAIDVDPEFLYGLEVPMADGEPPVKLGELKDALTAAKREARALQQRLEQAGNVQMPDAGPDISRWSQEMINAHGVLTALQHQYQSTNWDDPELDKGELAHHKQSMIEAFASAQNRFQHAAMAHQQTMGQAMELYKQAERQKLMERIPEWKSAEAVQADRQLMYAAAKEYGYSPQDVESLMDHRAFVLLRDLAKLKAAQVKTTEAVKQVRKAPKVLGSRTQKKQSNDVDQLIQQARKAPQRHRQHAEFAAAKAILQRG